MVDVINTQNILDNTQSLIDILQNDDMQSGIDDGEPNIYQISPYYEQNGLKRLLDEKTNIFNILSLNCQSLNAKFEQIKTYLEIYNNENNKISALCLQETWLMADSDLSLLQIPGYTLIARGKSCSAHGGVAIYLHEEFCYNILPINDNSEIWDGLFIEIFVKSHYFDTRKIVIGNVYRPPRPTVDNINTFRDEIQATLNNFRNFKDVLLTGDFNLDLLKCNENIHIGCFIEMIVSCGYIPKITMPTRLTQRQGTLIDNIFVKISDNFSSTTSGIIMSQISDHLPYFIFLDYIKFKQNSTKRIKVVSSSVEAYSNFKKDLESEDLKFKLSNVMGENPNESYSNLNKLLNHLVHKNFSVRYVKFKKDKHRKSNWITRGILKSIAYRDKLYIKLKSLPSAGLAYERHRTQLNTYNRILKNSIRIAKKNYYVNIFAKYKSDMKKTWATINAIINTSKAKKEFPKEFVVNGSSVTNEQDIANLFNDYYINIGPNLAEKIQNPQNKCYEDYLYNPNNSCEFNFKDVNKDIILKIISSLKAKSSSGIIKICKK